tara:strand:+ start:47 stop:388 length:342 start_codon:yes stop_codon:yes gene_type:complete
MSNTKTNTSPVLPEPIVGAPAFRGFALYRINRAINADNKAGIPWAYEVDVLPKVGAPERKVMKTNDVVRELGPSFRMGGDRFAILFGTDLKAITEGAFNDAVEQWRAGGLARV